MTVTIIIGVILLLFTAGFIALLSIRKEFVEESKYLELLEGELQNQPNATALHQSIISSLNIPQNSITSGRVEIVFKLSQKNISPNLSEISELAISTRESTQKVQASNFVLSTLLIVGLGGTFLAFREILAASGLSGTISNGAVDMVKYQEAIDKIYNGFNSAFLASVCGIFGTVMLLFVRFIIVNTVREQFFNRLDFITQSELVPIFSSLYKRPEDILSKTATKLDALITGLIPASQNLTSSAAQATTAITDLNQFAGVLKEATEKFSTFTSTDSPLIKAVDQLFEAVQKSESRYYQYQTAFTNLLTQIQDQNSRLAETQLKFIELHTILETLHTQFSVDFEKLNKNYQAEIAAVGQTFGNEIRTIIKSMGDVLGEAGTLINDLHSKQDAYAKDFKEAAEKLDSAMSKIEVTIKQLDSSMAKIDSPAKDILAKLADLQKLNGIDTKLIDLQKLNKIETSLQSLTGNDYKRDIERLINSTSEVHNMLKRVEASIKEKGGSQADIEAIQRSLRTINQTLEKKIFKFSVFGR